MRPSTSTGCRGAGRFRAGRSGWPQTQFGSAMGSFCMIGICFQHRQLYRQLSSALPLIFRCCAHVGSLLWPSHPITPTRCSYCFAPATAAALLCGLYASDHGVQRQNYRVSRVDAMSCLALHTARPKFLGYAAFALRAQGNGPCRCSSQHNMRRLSRSLVQDEVRPLQRSVGRRWSGCVRYCAVVRRSARKCPHNPIYRIPVAGYKNASRRRASTVTEAIAVYEKVPPPAAIDVNEWVLESRVRRPCGGWVPSTESGKRQVSISID
jgi:hypothetical protein